MLENCGSLGRGRQPLQTSDLHSKFEFPGERHLG